MRRLLALGVLVVASACPSSDPELEKRVEALESRVEYLEGRADLDEQERTEPTATPVRGPATRQTQRPSVIVDPFPAEAPPKGVGTLDLTVKPWGSVYVDGKQREGATGPNVRRLSLTLTAGKHTLLIQSSRFEDYRATIHVRADQELKVTVDLRTAPRGPIQHPEIQDPFN